MDLFSKSRKLLTFYTTLNLAKQQLNNTNSNPTWFTFAGLFEKVHPNCRVQIQKALKAWALE